jgi:chromosome segregation ATPase
MKLNLIAAAKEVQRDKSTLSRAIARGKLSAERQQDGSYLIDPAELSRAYPERRKNSSMATLTDATNEQQLATQVQVLQTQLEAALQRVVDKENNLRDKEQHLEELKQDRDHWRRQATALLEDKRPQQQGLWGRLLKRK